MEYPMKTYGPNLVELFLGRFLVATGWLLALAALGIGLALAISGDDGAESVFASGYLAGILVMATGLTGAILGLAGAGIRQNRGALELGHGLLALLAAAWLLSLIDGFRVGSLCAGLAILALFLIVTLLRWQSIQARFKPRFLKHRQFETMVQIIDAMIEADGKEVVHPIDAALRVDHMLSDIQEEAAGGRPARTDITKRSEADAPVLQEIRMLLFVVEWVLPLLIFRPFPFSALGSTERRRAVDRVIDSRWPLLRDAARLFKTAACVGYYGSPEAQAQVGYVPFEERERSRGVDQTPRTYPDPFLETDAS